MIRNRVQSLEGAEHQLLVQGILLSPDDENRRVVLKFVLWHLCLQVPLKIRQKGSTKLKKSLTYVSLCSTLADWGLCWVEAPRPAWERKDRGVWHTLQHTETTEAQKQKSNFLCVTAGWKIKLVVLVSYMQVWHKITQDWKRSRVKGQVCKHTNCISR